MAEKEHSKNFEKVKRYYGMGGWNLKMVANAVKKGWITEEEFKQITGQPYEAEE